MGGEIGSAVEHYLIKYIFHGSLELGLGNLRGEKKDSLHLKL